MNKTLPDDLASALSAVRDDDLLTSAMALADDRSLFRQARELNEALVGNRTLAVPLAGYFTFDSSVEVELIAALRSAMNPDFERRLARSPWASQLGTFDVAIPDPESAERLVRLAEGLVDSLTDASLEGLQEVQSHHHYDGVTGNEKFGPALSHSTEPERAELVYASFLLIFWRSVVVSWTVSSSDQDRSVSAGLAPGGGGRAGSLGPAGVQVETPTANARSDNERALLEFQSAMRVFDWNDGLGELEESETVGEDWPGRVSWRERIGVQGPLGYAAAGATLVIWARLLFEFLG